MTRDAELNNLLNRSIDNSMSTCRVVNMLLLKLSDNKIPLTADEIQSILDTAFVNVQIITDRADLHVTRLGRD